MSFDPAADGPTTIVDLPVGDAPAEQVLGAVDAVLGGHRGDLAVRLLVPESHPARPALAELCAADPRLGVAATDAPPEPCRMRVVVPPSARPGERALDAFADLLADGSIAAVEAAVPGRLGALSRTALSAHLPGATRVRAERPGATGRTMRVTARRVDLGSDRGPPAGAPPRASLSRERAEHLRHRARSTTGRARLDRNAQRLTRERMRFQHERARAALLDERLAAVSARHRAGRWLRRGSRMAAAVPLRVWSLLRGGRALYRRGRRFLRDRLRRRRSPAPRGQSR